MRTLLALTLGTLTGCACDQTPRMQATPGTYQGAPSDAHRRPRARHHARTPPLARATPDAHEPQRRDAPITARDRQRSPVMVNPWEPLFTPRPGWSPYDPDAPREPLDPPSHATPDIELVPRCIGEECLREAISAFRECCYSQPLEYCWRLHLRSYTSDKTDATPLQLEPFRETDATPL